MFLSKKTPCFTVKQKSNDTNKPKKMLGGWDDDEQQKKHSNNQVPKNDTISKQQNLLQGDNFISMTASLPQKIQVQQNQYFNWDELNERNNIQCQKKLVEEIIQPGGIRIKPSDSVLNQFAKQIKGMEAYIIGSLLLSKIQVNYPFQVKAKALYTMEFLSKKYPSYLDYFKKYVDQIKGFPQPEDNIENYKKILKTFLNYIGVVSSLSTTQESQKPVFNDPGYNDQPKKSSISNFIQQNIAKPKKVQMKKTIIGPGQTKSKPFQVKQQNPKAVSNLMNIDLLESINDVENPAKDNGDIDLLEGMPDSKPKQITFDQLLAAPPSKPAINSINLLY